MVGMLKYLYVWYVMTSLWLLVITSLWLACYNISMVGMLQRLYGWYVITFLWLVCYNVFLVGISKSLPLVWCNISRVGML